MLAVKAPRRLALDTVSYFSPFSEAVKTTGAETVFRYINYNKHFRDTPDTSGDWFISLSKQERDEILNDGWMIGIVQRGIGRRNSGGRDAGLEVGEAAVYNATGLNIPTGVTIFCDCEWSDPPNKADQIAYIEAWASQVRGAGYIAGLYVSPDLALSSSELYALAHIQAYWKSASYVATVDTRGFQIIQSLEYFFETATGALYPWSDSCYSRQGLRLDMDMVCADGLAYSGSTGRLMVVSV